MHILLVFEPFSYADKISIGSFNLLVSHTGSSSVTASEGAKSSQMTIGWNVDVFCPNCLESNSH